MRKEIFSIGKLLLVPLFALVLILSGCEGDDGSQGPQGPVGPPGGTVIDASTASATTLAEIDVQSEVNSVTIASPPVVKFTLKDSHGIGITGLAALKANDARFIRFTLVKLVPGTNGNPDSWVSYVRDADGLPTYDNTGTLVDHGNGSYTYTFAKDVSTVTGVTYQPTLTHRLGGQIGSGSVALEAQNFAYDFVPAGGAVTPMRNIATMDSCNECHGNLVFHGRRFEVEYCVTCHNPDLIEGPDSLNMSTMTHKIHSANPTYIDGYFAEVTYPQGKNCLKCHNGADSATPQGNNWKNRPNIAACGGCHIIDFVTGIGHEGAGVNAIQLDNSGCIGCHSATAIEGYHVSENATPNNPNVPAGAANFTYEIKGVTVNGSNQPVITFRIQSSIDGSTPTPVVFDGPGSTASTVPANAVLSNYTGSPSFLIAYAMPQSGIATPAEYNNLGRAAAQPASLSIAYIRATGNTRGTITGPVADGYYVATIIDPVYQFPVGATLRAVALQGYFTQTNLSEFPYSPGPPASGGLARHTIAAVKPVTATLPAVEAVRREVIDNAKCANCHEWFEGHGGNRVYDMKVCVFCHVPNLSTSGRGANLANVTDPILIALGVPANYPEDTNNFKDMIHGIHASGMRTNDYTFVRDRGTSGVYYYNWAEVTFPGILNNCSTCHKDGVFKLPVDTNALPTTMVTALTDGSDADAIATVAEGRASLPNAGDIVISPNAAACVYCHDSDLAKGHMEQNGAYYGTRSSYDANETCALCHGAGRSADVETVHR